MGHVRWIVLVVVVLYWAQAVLVPLALAILLTFVLTPPVGWLEQWVGRVPAVLHSPPTAGVCMQRGDRATSSACGMPRQSDRLRVDLVPRHTSGRLHPFNNDRNADAVRDAKEARSPELARRSD